MAKVKQEPVELAHLDELRQFCLTLRARNKKPTHRLADRPAICDPQFADLREGVVAWDRSQGWQLCPRWWVVLQKKRDALVAQLEQERQIQLTRQCAALRKGKPITLQDVRELSVLCEGLRKKPNRAAYIQPKPGILGTAYADLREGIVHSAPGRGWQLQENWQRTLKAKRDAVVREREKQAHPTAK